MPIDEVQRSVRCLNDDKLGAAWFVAAMTDRYLTFTAERPAREDQIAVAAITVRDIQLIEVRLDAKLMRQHCRLVVETRTTNVTVHFLQANEIGFLLLDDIHNSLDSVTAIRADTFVDIVGQQAHLF